MYYFQCNSSAGTVMLSEESYNFKVDTQNPSRTGASITVNNGDAYDFDGTLNFTWNGFTDTAPNSGIYGYYYNTSNQGGTANGYFTFDTNGTLTTSLEGSVSVYVWAVDNVSNIGLSVSDGITVDTSYPTVSLQSTVPAVLSIDTTGSFRVNMDIFDNSGLIMNPTLRFRIGTDAWSSWYNTTNVGGGIYRYDIPEQSSPNTWYDRGGEYIYWELNATDLFNRSTVGNASEFINNGTSPPVLGVITPKSVGQDNDLIFNITATDSPGDTLTYTCNRSDITITKINDGVATVSWTPDQYDVGIHFVRFSVSDGLFNDTQIISITVTNTNDRPILVSIGSLISYEYEYFNYTCNATDVDNDNLTFYDNSSLFRIGPSSGLIDFTPSYTHRGEYQINISVTDGNGGWDSEAITFTVAYCGDEVCDSLENCTTCEEDCNTCDEDTSAAIIIEPRNCLNYSMTIQAVMLVKRTECEIKGDIIDGKEVCGNLSDIDIDIYILENREYTWLDTITTDDDGYTTYNPARKGEYKLVLGTSSYGDIEEIMTVKECLEHEIKEQQKKEQEILDNRQQKETPIENQLPTVIEESGIERVITAILYFFLIPMLVLILIFFILAYIYKSEKKKSGSKYVNTVDMILGKIKENYVGLIYFIKTSKYTRPIIDFLYSSKKKLIYFMTKLSNTQAAKEIRLFIVNIWDTVENILVKRMVSVPFIAISDNFKIHPGDQIIISILNYYNKNKDIEKELNNLKNKIHTKITNLIEMAWVGSRCDLDVIYYSKFRSEDKKLKEVIEKGGNHIIKEPELRDIEFSINKKRIPVIISDFGKLNRLHVSAPVFTLITGFDNKYIYLHDPISKKQKANRKISKKRFKEAWSIPGVNKELIVFNQKPPKKPSKPKIQQPQPTTQKSEKVVTKK